MLQVQQSWSLDQVTTWKIINGPKELPTTLSILVIDTLEMSGDPWIGLLTAGICNLLAIFWDSWDCVQVVQLKAYKY